MKKFVKILLITTILLFSFNSYSQNTKLRKDVVKTFKSEIGVRELTGNNDGVDVEKYLASTKLGKGYPWCASFTTWGFDENGVKNPKSAWSPHWALKKDRIWNVGMPVSLLRKLIQPGDVFTIYYNSKKRVGHVGVFIGWSPSGRLITVEGNTNLAGSRLGIGVFQRERSISQIYAITDYVTPSEKEHVCNH